MELFNKGKNNFSYFDFKGEVQLCQSEDTIEVTEKEARRLQDLFGDDIKIISKEAIKDDEDDFGKSYKKKKD